jgi:hypothetical protein
MQKTFVDTLKEFYEQLYSHYNYIYSKCILEKQRKHFKKYLVCLRGGRRDFMIVPTAKTDRA